MVEFDGQEYNYNNVSGSQNIEIDRTNTEQNTIKVTVIPNGEISFDVSSDCPKGEPMKIVTMVLTDPGADLTMMFNKFRWGNSHNFDVPNLPYDESYGVRGVGKFPLNNSQMYMTKAEIRGCGHRLLYAIGDFSQGDVIENAIEHSGTFTFLTSDPNSTLYMIWDYTDKIVTPEFDDFGSVCQGETPSLPTTSLNGITGVWTKIASAKYNNTLKYLFTPDAGQCAKEIEVEIEETEKITPEFNNFNDEYCEGENIDLPNVSDNGITGGWSSELIEETDGFIKRKYTFTPDAGQCAEEFENIVIVYKRYGAEFNNLQTEYCQGENIDLPNTSDNGIMGSWSSELIEETDEFIKRKYNFKHYVGENFCVDWFSIVVTIYKKKTPEFSNLKEIYCMGESMVLPNISDNGIMGSWRPEFHDKQIMTHVFTPDAGQCAEAVEITIEVKENIVPIFDKLKGNYCEGESIDLHNVSDNGITGSWVGKIIYEDNSFTRWSYTFTPDASEYCAQNYTHEFTVWKIPHAQDFDVYMNPGQSYAEIHVLANNPTIGSYTHVEIVTPPQHGQANVVTPQNWLDFIKYQGENGLNDVFIYRICSGNIEYGCCSNEAHIRIICR